MLEEINMKIHRILSSALIKGKTPLEALEWAPINPMSVVQYVGAQHGLLTQNELEEFLKRKPENYKPVLL